VLKNHRQYLLMSLGFRGELFPPAVDVLLYIFGTDIRSQSTKTISRIQKYLRGYGLQVNCRQLDAQAHLMSHQLSSQSFRFRLLKSPVETILRTFLGISGQGHEVIDNSPEFLEDSNSVLDDPC
jgi:hypothetical protein